MKKRVLLVAPYIHDFAAFDLWLKPLGLLYVAAAAEEAGYGVRVVNCLDRLHPAAWPPGASRSSSHGDGRGKLPFQVIAKPECLESVPRQYKRYGIPPDILREEVAGGQKPDAIGVGSMMTYWRRGVAETIAILREIWPGAPVILGGVYATLCPEDARRRSGADIVAEGRGEERFIDILRREIGAAGAAKSPPLRPAYHLLENLDSVSMLTSYGCPFSCAYCASNLLQPTFIQRPTAEVIDEIAGYREETRIRHIAFYDDALLVNADRHIKPILRGIADRGLDVRLHTPNGLHADLIDAEIASLMKASGFSTVRLSVESINKARLEDSCMKVTMRGFEAAVSHLFSAGYGPGEIEAYVMMGAPGQRIEEVEQTMRFVHEAGGVIKLADFSPIPGTAYFDAAVEEYGLDPTEPLFQNSSALPYLVPGLSEQYRALKDRARSMNSKLPHRAPKTPTPDGPGAARDAEPAT